MSELVERLGVDRLSVADRLDLIGAIWDTLPESDAGPIPEWHLRELERRRAAAEADPGAGIPWEQVKARLTSRS